MSKCSHFLAVCIVLVQPPLRVLFHAHTSSGLSLIAPVSGRRMQRFLQFRLGCHGLQIAVGRLAGAGRVGRANRVCLQLACNSGGVGDEISRSIYSFECTALAHWRQQHADLFTPRTVTMCSIFAQQNHLGVLNYVIDCLNFMNNDIIAMIGTSDQSCWLAEASSSSSF